MFSTQFLVPVTNSFLQNLMPSLFPRTMMREASVPIETICNGSSIGSDGLPKLVNVWIPLTDATTLNSCMHVLPGHLDPLYPHGGSRANPVGDQNKLILLQNVRALPAKAGSILCWSTGLLHWGGRSSQRATHPRLSFAVYFQSRELPPVHSTTMNIPSPISFRNRVYLVERRWQDDEDPPI